MNEQREIQNILAIVQNFVSLYFFFFLIAEEGKHHLKQLVEVLVTYMQYNQDIRYMQGMNEIAATFLRITGDDVETFWWFHAFMEQYVFCFYF